MTETDALTRRRRFPDFSAAEIQTAVAEAAAIFNTVQGTTPCAAADYGKSYTICMTPRSGSTFLADAMTKTGAFGHPQEYLHRLEPTALAAHTQQYGAKTWEAYLAALAAKTASANGMFGLKADPSMLLPLCVDGTFDRTLRRGQFIYVTRTDLVMQAISLTRAQHTGAWTSRTQPGAAPVFSFTEVYRNVVHLAEMRGRWESFFALNGIKPLRLTYERIDADIDGVLADIADFLHVPRPPRGPSHAKVHQRDDVSVVWREQFLRALAPV